MTKRNNGALAIGIVIVIVAALVAIFHQSRTFTQIMGQDYAPEKVDSIHVYLQAMGHDAPSREVVLSGEDPAAQELLALLGSQTYDVGYEVGAIEGHAVPLDYTITLILTMEPEEEGASAPFLYFDGSDEATMDGLDRAAGSNGWVRTHYRVDLAFQQEILDLLLAQPYEEIL